MSTPFPTQDHTGSDGRVPPGYPPPPWTSGGHIPQRLIQPAAPWVLSAVAILFCWPLAIVALVLSSRVAPAWNQGEVRSAQQVANHATVWACVAIGVGTLWWLFWFLVSIGASISQGGS